MGVFNRDGLGAEVGYLPRRSEYKLNQLIIVGDIVPSLRYVVLTMAIFKRGNDNTYI
jgi:hypothetical protein